MDKTAGRERAAGERADEDLGTRGGAPPHMVWGNYTKSFIFTIIVRMATQHKQIDEQTLENLLYLSRLSPESTNMETLKKQVDDIVGYFEILSKYDDSENPYDAYPTTTADALRGDTVVEGLDMPDVKKVSENFMDGYFQVPKVLGEGA